MTAHKTPVIGHVTPLAGKGEPIKYADDDVREAVKRGPSVKTHPLAVLERSRADMVTVRTTTPVVDSPIEVTIETEAERAHAPIARPTSGLACEMCDETTSVSAVPDLPECDCHDVPSRHLDDDGHLPGCRRPPVITPEIARELVAEGQEASAEYMGRVRRLPEPDPAPAYEDDWERENRIAGTTEELEQLRADLAQARATIEMMRVAADQEAERVCAWHTTLLEAMGYDAGADVMPLDAAVRFAAERVRELDATTDAIEPLLRRAAIALDSDVDGDLLELAKAIDGATVDLQRAHTKAERSRDRWESRARRAEARVKDLEAMAEALTAERDGLEEERDDANQRVARKVAGQVRKRKAGPKRGR